MSEDFSQFGVIQPDGTWRSNPGAQTLPPMCAAEPTKPTDLTGPAGPTGLAGPTSPSRRRIASNQPNPPRTVPNRTTADRFAILNAFVDCSLPGLSRVELGTWLCLYRDVRDGTARTAQTDIARRLGVTVRAVGKAVQRLCRVGLLELVHQGGMNSGPSRYRVVPTVKQSQAP